MKNAPVLNRQPSPEYRRVAHTAPHSSRTLARLGAFLMREFYEILPPTIFFFVGFNLIWLTTNLILADYFVTFGNFMLATAAALIAGKSVLLADATPLIRRYDRAPLIKPILFKTVIYCLIVFVARVLEHLVRFWFVERNPLGGFLPHMISTFSWDRFAAIQIWIFVLFLLYVTASELIHLFGDGELYRIFFAYRPSELQLNRRQRIRQLVHLSRLADEHSIEVLTDPTSKAHSQLIDIITRLAVRPQRPDE